MFKVDVVNGGDLAARALIYKQPSYSMTEYFLNNMNNVLNTVNNLSTSFVDSVKSLYNKFNSNEVIMASKQLLHQAGMSFNDWSIYTVPYGHFHQANLGMQRYIMLQPDVFKRYTENRCYGFQETFIDPEPDTPLEERVMYQNVMDGILQFDKEGYGYYNTYSNTSEEELGLIDKISVLDTWHEVNRMLKEGFDPTDPDYEEL